MERLTFSDAGPADWPYLLCLWWRNVRTTHGFVAEDYLRAIGAALPGVYLPAMERVRLAWLEVAPAEGDGSDHAPGAGEGHFPTGTVAVPRPSLGRLPAGFLGSVEQRVEMLFVEPGLRGRGRRDRANSLTHGLSTASHPCRHNRGRHPLLRRGYSGDVAAQKTETPGGDPAFWHRPGE